MNHANIQTTIKLLNHTQLLNVNNKFNSNGEISCYTSRKESNATP